MATKIRVYDVKTALQRAKHKISTLENELLVKESWSESEDELSLSTWTHSKELKDSLVDMYKANPKVNEELKQRLPSPVRPAASDATAPLGLSDSGATTSNLIVPEAERDWPRAPQHLRSSRSPSPQPGSPKSPRGSPSPRAQRAPPRPSATPRSPPGPAPRCRAPQAPQASQAPQGRAMQEADRAPGRSPTEGPRAEGPGGGAGSRGPGSPAQRRQHQLPLPLPCPGEGGRATTPSLQPDHGGAVAPPSPTSRRSSPALLDKEKNIAFLLKELDSLRDLNKRLQDKMALREKELESRLVDAELQEAELESRACEKAAALVEEIYLAQRDRDQAVMARLRLANEERDEALLRAKRLQQAATEIESINPEESDLDLEELLNRVNGADCALGVERSGAVMVDRLLKARERHRKITAQEMSTVLDERDSALARCKRVEHELLLIRDQQSQTSPNAAGRRQAADHLQERARKEELEAAQRERDRALEHIQRLEAELQALRTYQSLHQSQCEYHQSGSSLGSPSTPVPRDSSSPLGSLAPPAALLAQLQQLATEHHGTQARLQLSQQAEREASERVQKLERLVEVLRKKVGTGSLRTVI